MPLPLWTLIQLLERFRQLDAMSLTAMIQSLRVSFEQNILQIGGGATLIGTDPKTVRDIAERAHALFKAVGFERAEHAALQLAREVASNKTPDYSSVKTSLHALEMAILTDSTKHKFLQIRNDRAEFFPWPRGSGKKDAFGFGPKVDEAFPSAIEDISEAGYCLAVEANTGAVYHMICAAEHGLRALARDRRVVFPKGPIELQQWGDIIRELEKAVATINNWPKSRARETASEFYNKAVKECRYFNEAYRRHVAHARRHYDRYEALSAMTHVRDFLQLLSTHISEKKRTPLIWKRV